MSSKIGNAITLYLVGTDEEDAKGNLLFDSMESAESCAQDNGGLNVYTVTAHVDLSTIERL